MDGRIYYAAFSNVSVSAAQDVLELAPATGKPIIPLHVVITVRDDETNQQLEFTVQRRTTSGSGGSTITPAKSRTSDAAAGCVVERNNTTRATGGTQEIFAAEGVPAPAGFAWLPTPQEEVFIYPGEYFIIGLENAPASAIGMSGWVAFKEL